MGTVFNFVTMSAHNLHRVSCYCSVYAVHVFLWQKRLFLPLIN